MPLRRAALALAAALSSAGCASTGSRPPDPGCGLPTRAAAQSLAARIDADGRFVYRIGADGRTRDGYNIVRHAGSLWALAAYREAFPDDPSTDRSTDRASAFLADCCLRAPPGTPAQLALWSVPDGEPLVAKLGAAGLALAAWSDRARIGASAPPLADLRRLARFIVARQHPDGRFDSKFIHDRPDRSGWQSLYYPGEAALGLLALDRLDPASGWRQPAIRALTVLAEARIASGDWPPDHWALIATRHLHDHAPDDVGPALRIQVRRIAEALLAGQRDDGAFDAERRSAPAATRLEALIAAAQVLGPGDPPLAARLHAAIDRGSRFLRQGQRTAPPHRGAMTRAAPPSTAARAGELRIDDTQHALSVWLGAAAIQNDSCTRA